MSLALPTEAFGNPKDRFALLPYQQKWFADRSPVKLFTKSRRIGISWTEGADAALTAARMDGMNITYICYDKDITRQFIKDCAEWAKVYNLVASEIQEYTEVFRDGDEDKSILIFRIYFASGFEIEAIAGTPRKLRGRKGRIIIDEAAFLDKFLEVLEAALAMLIWGGDIHIITTYNGVDNEYYELEQDVLAGKLPYSRHFTTFDMAIADGLYKRVCLVRGIEWTLEGEFEFVKQTYDFFGDKADQELRCIPKNSGGKYFPLVLLERCMRWDSPIATFACDDKFVVKPEEKRVEETDTWLRLNVEPLLSRLKPNLKTSYGMDFARSGDLSVFLPLQEEESLRRVCPFGIELRNVPYEQQKQILFWIVKRFPRFVAGAMDATGNGGYLAEVAMQQFGATRIHCISLSRPWYAENFPRYLAAMEDDNIALPKSSNWKDDHRLVELDKGVPLLPQTTFNGTDGLQRHGDSAVAGVLAWFASCNPGAPIEFRALPGKRLAYGLNDYVGGNWRDGGW